MTEYNVALQMKIYLEDPSKLESVKAAINGLQQVKVEKIREEDVGFGIKILKVVFLMNDAEGGADVLEEKVKSIENVSQVEVESVSRI